MELRRKLTILADAAKYDASCASGGGRTRGATAGGIGSTEAGSGICHTYTPDGRCVSLLKILLTNYCVYDCSYCINRVSSNTERARFTPGEVVQLTLDFYRRNYIEGLFLSSGVLKSPDYTMEQIVEIARLLREEHRFAGYIHLKTVPGASAGLVERAGQYADRLSCNIELPTPADLAALAPEKQVDQIDRTMQTIRNEHERARSERGMGLPFAPAGQTTQMIIGATVTDDARILATADRLYRRFHLRRVIYSAYSPIPDASSLLPSKTPPLIREHRLTQADWLLRFYGFTVDEIAPAERSMLDLDVDPKLAWALRHRELFPVDVNRASRELLLRVPGLGRRTVERILRMRRHVAVTSSVLARLRIPIRRMRPFLLTADRVSAGRDALDRLDLRALLTPPEQLELFTARTSAIHGEL